VTLTRRILIAHSAALATLGVARAQQVPAPTSAAEVPGMPAGTIMTKEFRLFRESSGRSEAIIAREVLVDTGLKGLGAGA
jgi:hypothetical protein